jgi:hypothetical protein
MGDPKAVLNNPEASADDPVDVIVDGGRGAVSGGSLQVVQARVGLLQASYSFKPFAQKELY